MPPARARSELPLEGTGTAIVVHSLQAGSRTFSFAVTPELCVFGTDPTAVARFVRSQSDKTPRSESALQVPLEGYTTFAVADFDALSRLVRRDQEALARRWPASGPRKRRGVIFSRRWT